ncbi:unnamed protein product [Acanthosepion pharaonis]|uniref:Uncharacterized protein n=1 Tax=Acanthosepion pharaonis TaxID=158019 RepID=A0A812C872_ACAPH|nr:unnamed protein product [Sepia pharaonis]
MSFLQSSSKPLFFRFHFNFSPFLHIFIYPSVPPYPYFLPSIIFIHTLCLSFLSSFFYILSPSAYLYFSVFPPISIFILQSFSFIFPFYPSFLHSSFFFSPLSMTYFLRLFHLRYFLPCFIFLHSPLLSFFSSKITQFPYIFSFFSFPPFTKHLYYSFLPSFCLFYSLNSHHSFFTTHFLTFFHPVSFLSLLHFSIFSFLPFLLPFYLAIFLPSFFPYLCSKMSPVDLFFFNFLSIYLSI